MAPRSSTTGRLAVHELRHDLGRARMLAAEVQAALPDAAAAERATRSLETLLERMQASLETLLAGEADTAQRRPTQLAALVERVVQVHDPDLRRVLLQVPSAVVNLDPIKLERIIDNLLTNALEHAPTGSTVRLLVDALPRAVHVTVENPGAAIPDAVRERVTDPDHDDDLLPSGLDVVARFARAHGGRVQIHGPGVSVRVELPLASTATTHAAPTR